MIDKAREDEVRALLGEPLMAESLPITFSSGRCLNEVHLPCAKCTRPVQPHGHVHYMNRHVISMDMAGYCGDCKLVTPAHARVYDDGRVVCKNINGDWINTGTVLTNPLSKLLAKLRGLAIRLWRL